MPDRRQATLNGPRSDLKHIGVLTRLVLCNGLTDLND